MKSGRRKWMQACAGAAAIPLASGLAQADERRKGEKKSPIKVGQIGVGHAHATKLSVYRDSDDYEVVGVVEPDAKLRERTARSPAFRGVPVMTQEQLLNTADLQVVLVETRVGDSLDVAQACVAAGKHVHLDKPAGESLGQYRRILEAAAQQNLMVQMGYMYRYNPAVVLMRDFLKRGWLGEVFEIHTVMSKVVPPASRRALAEFPGGMMFELGCHILDLVIGVLGKPNSVNPYAQHASSIEDKLVDNMLSVLSYPRATATVRSSAMEVDGFARRHFVVCGDKGTFHIQPLDNPSAEIALSTARDGHKKGRSQIRFPKYSRYVGDAADMAKIIRQEKECDFTYEHDYNVQETLLKSCGLESSLEN